MFRLQEPLPTLKKPVIMNRALFNLTKDDFFLWFKRYLTAKGGNSLFENFMKITKDLNVLQGLPYEQKLLILLTQPVLEKMGNALYSMESVIGEDCLPLTELKAQYITLFSEVSDLYLHNDEIGKQWKEINNRIVWDHLGVKSLDGVLHTYRMALHQISHCCLRYVNNGSEEYPETAITMCGILYDQWFVLYLKILGKYLLLVLTKELYKISPETHIIASCENEIIPLIVTHPETRNVINEEIQERIYRSPIEFFLENEMNTSSSGIEAFTNLAIIAVIVNDLTYARTCLTYARAYATGQTIPQILKLERIIAILEPTVQAS